MVRSGGFQRDLAQNKAAEARTRAGVQQGLDSTLSNLESQLAQKNMDIASRQAQQQLSMIGQGYRSDPLAGLAFLNDPNFKPPAGPDLTPLTSPAFLNFLKSKGVSA